MKKTGLYIALCIALLLCMAACAQRQEAEQPAPTETPAPTAAPVQTPTAPQTARPRPTPTPTPPGTIFGRKNISVKCKVSENNTDTESYWYVYSPTKEPDPSWTIVSVEGEVVKYSSFTCPATHRIKKEHIECPIKEGEIDTKSTWLVYNTDTERPGVNWEIESEDEDSVTYVLIECGHGPAGTDTQEQQTESTPAVTPEG